MYPDNTIIEGHNLVKPSDDFKKEVASTSENIAKPRYTQFDKSTASAGCHFTVLSRIFWMPV
jgi:hypothetical protein